MQLNEQEKELELLEEPIGLPQEEVVIEQDASDDLNAIVAKLNNLEELIKKEKNLDSKAPEPHLNKNILKIDEKTEIVYNKWNFSIRKIVGFIIMAVAIPLFLIFLAEEPESWDDGLILVSSFMSLSLFGLILFLIPTNRINKKYGMKISDGRIWFFNIIGSLLIIGGGVGVILSFRFVPETFMLLDSDLELSVNIIYLCSGIGAVLLGILSIVISIIIKRHVIENANYNNYQKTIDKTIEAGKQQKYSVAQVDQLRNKVNELGYKEARDFIKSKEYYDSILKDQ